MKKSILILAICLLLLGCGKNMNYEDTMKEYATTFYNLHKKGQENLNSLKISIADLKEAIEVVKDNYDMSKLEGCKDESYVELIVDKTTKEIKEIKYNLQCEDICVIDDLYPGLKMAVDAKVDPLGVMYGKGHELVENKMKEMCKEVSLGASGWGVGTQNGRGYA